MSLEALIHPLPKLSYSEQGSLEVGTSYRMMLNDKFSSPEHSGPTDVVSFLGILDEEENDMIKRDVFEQISGLIKLLK